MPGPRFISDSLIVVLLHAFISFREKVFIAHQLIWLLLIGMVERHYIEFLNGILVQQGEIIDRVWQTSLLWLFGEVQLVLRFVHELDSSINCWLRP